MRELAAIHRSDASLIVSTHETKLLTDTYGVNPRKLHLGVCVCVCVCVRLCVCVSLATR